PRPQPVMPQQAMQPAPQREMPQPVAAAPQRMPRVEDFPPVVRAEVEAKTRPADHENSGPMGLIKRLTNGLTRREEEPARLQPAQPREPKLRQAAPEMRRLASQDPQLYAPRRGQLDDQGRLTPQSRTVQEDDQLEIPAFLRRQAN
ncbi:MAG: cell division protein FtsZ, partial [Mesorhizobium sp.]